MSALPRRLSPSMVVALLALFFAIGGSAFAIGQKVVPQPRCAAGAVRGIAVVTGDPGQGIANFPQEYTSARNLVRYAFNCNSKPVEIKRADNVFYVRFVGNVGKAAFVSVIGASSARPLTVDGPQPDGSYKVSVIGSGEGGFGPETPFEILLV